MICADPWCSAYRVRHEHIDGDPDEIRELPGEPGWDELRALVETIAEAFGTTPAEFIEACRAAQNEDGDA